MTTQSDKKTLADLIAVMEALRDPVSGCPWDQKQTFATIAPYTIEEAYEVSDAIARSDLADLKEELGDLLLQVVYHSRIAEEGGSFSFDDVADGITRKMIRRHPHVFGTEVQRTAGAAHGFWENIKAEERAEKAAERMRLAEMDGEHGRVSAPITSKTSLLSDVPLALPALTRAIKLQDKAARVGFDWPSLAPVFDKMREELSELEAVTASDDEGKVEEEFGDLLFVVANVARHLRLDPEEALRKANSKFTRRFAHIEARLAEQGREPAQSTLEEMDALWDEAKLMERGLAD